MSFKSFFKYLVVAFSGALFAVIGMSAQAAYPEKPINFVCWSSPGSPLDTMMRKLASLMEQDLGQPISVENRRGGSGAVAMAYVMSQPADGYTVLSTTSSMTFTMAKGRVPFTPDDFVVLRALQSEPSSVAVRNDSDLKSMKDFVETLKAKPNGLRVGGYASAGFHQFVFYQLRKATGIEAAWIPFDGGNKAALALLGGHLDAAVMTPSSALSQVKSGEIQLLGVSTAARSAYLPDAPTMAEQEYDVVEAIWRGVMVKAGTPQDVIDRLLASIGKAEASDDWKEFMNQRQQLPVDLSLEELAKQVRREVAERREFLESGGFLKK